MKKIILTTLVTAGLVSFSGASFAKVYKLAHGMPTEHPVHKSLVFFAKALKTEAHMRVKVFPNNTLGIESALLQMLQNGTITFAKVSAAQLVSFSKDYKILSLPYLYKNMDQYHHVLDGPIGKKILMSSEKDGFIGLTFLEAGSRNFYANKPIKTPSDLKGLKVRVQDSPISIDTMKALGATAVPLPYSEVYSGLQQGVVDSAENNIPSFYSSRHYEVKKVFSYDKHTMIPDVLVVSTEIWKTFSKEKQDQILKVAKEAEAQQVTNWNNYVIKSMKKLKEAKVKFIQADIPAFQKAVEPVYTKFYKENPDLKQIVKDIQNTK